MDFLRLRLPLRLLAALATMALALAGTACGSSDDGSDDGGGNAAQADGGEGDTAPVSSGGSDEEQIRAVYARWLHGVRTPNPKEACSTMTAETRKKYEVLTGEYRPCEERIRRLSKVITDGQNPRIKKLTIKGKKAEAILETQEGKQVSLPTPFAKRNGEWKISGGLGTPNAPKSPEAVERP